MFSCDNFLKEDVTSDIQSLIYKQENFDVNESYQPISLLFKGKSLLKPGVKVDDLDSTFSFRSDPNLDYSEYSDVIIDYLSISDEYIIEMPNGGSINGIVYFSASKKDNQIFNIANHWIFDTKVNDSTEQEINNLFIKKVFPVLIDKIDFINNWSYTIDKELYLETFKLDSTSSAFGWGLSYEVIMK
jgi:hypothetical protein